MDNYNKEEEWNDIKTNFNKLELFYKMRLCYSEYKYSNIILAFNEYGIKCNELSINERLLELWDIEILSIYYEVKNNIKNELRKAYLYNKYKMESIDTCDYRNYCINLSDQTDDEIYDTMNDRINGMIRKMKKNSILLIKYE